MAILYNIDDLGTKKILDEFLEVIQIYLTSPKYGSSIVDNSREGLKVFHKLPFVLSSTLFLLNDETYDFEHIITNPTTKIQLAKEKFDRYIDNRLIDCSFSEGSIFVEELKNDSDDVDFRGMIIPLIFSWGIIGTVILEIDEVPQEHIENFKKVCGIHGRIFASVIERIRLFDKLQDANELLSGTVKSKTVDLNRAQEELLLIYNNLPVGVVLYDHETNSIFKANPYARELFEFADEDDIIGKRLEDLTDKKAWNEILDESFETEIKKSSGESIFAFCQVNQVLMHGESFSIISFIDISKRKEAEDHIIFVNNDLEKKVAEKTADLEENVAKLEKEIKEKKEAQKELQTKLDQEKELNQMKFNIVNNVSHEFRTPLTIIRSTVQILESYSYKMDKSQKASHFETVYESIDFMIDLLENATYINKQEDAFKDLRIEIKLDDFLNKIINEIQKKTESQHKINIDISEPKEIQFKSKPLRLIIINLLSNAIKYSDNNSSINIKSSIYNNKLTISIEDEGQGIPEKSQKLIFEPFYRAENVGASSGTGLGLAVIKSIVEKLGGDISFKSSESGTHFLITLPLNNE